MQDKYSPAEVERAAQTHWNQRDAYRVTEDQSKKKFYACSMLPYPSGKLHMGHVRNYTINDMLTRQLRMRGYNVLMPMGWDAFGLPAENAALKGKIAPAKWTYENIAYMKKQMQALGLAIDWSREIATCDPTYYKWNQWLFLKMLNAGICERRTQVVNWDPVDQTVLANEQVIDGKGWRSGAVIEKREIPGYYLNITKYAPKLLESVQQGLEGWPERVKLMQENWIGKSEGVRFAFTHKIKKESKESKTGVENHQKDQENINDINDINDIKDSENYIQDGKLYVFTTRADTIMGVTFCAVAPEHPLAQHAAQTNADLAAFILECQSGGTTEAELATQEKKGMKTGLFVTHPLSNEPIEVWVGNYVLMGYGDGAVMGVPAHDERDFAFANKYGLPIKQVIQGEAVKNQADLAFSSTVWQDWYADKQQARCINSGSLNELKELDGKPFKEAVDFIAGLLIQKGLGEKKITWRLRDWGISRQRYWGTPIPIIHCDEHGAVPVPEKDLPVVLPSDCIPDGTGNPLVKHEGFHANVTCPICKKAAKRETDTMDTFVDSSWYFMRYCDPKNDQKMVAEGANYWMPMDQYIGGIEHAILHLLYARFWTKVMRDLKLINVSEPFTKLLTQGMVLNEAFVRTGETSGKEYFWAHDLDIERDEHSKVTSAISKKDALPVTYEGWTTMSKSKNNGVDPQDLIEKYGADTARLYTMFTAPPEATLEWNESAVEGSHRFLKRVWAFAYRLNELIGTNAVRSNERDLDLNGANAVRPYADNSASVNSNQNALNLRANCLRQALVSVLKDAQISKESKALRYEMYSNLKQIDFDYQRMQYNTVVSGVMKMLNALEDFKAWESQNAHLVLIEGFSLLLRCLYPATPHLAHQLWEQLGFADHLGDLLDAPWATIDESALQKDEIELMLQINGKLRGSILVASTANKEEIESIALASEVVKRYQESLGNATPKKVIVVLGRLVNVVL